MNNDDQDCGDRLLQVGELAKCAGVSVRTLHHYQAIGLLIPTTRSHSGYRLYDKSAIIRLQQITSLRAVGMSLAAIENFLDDEEVSTWQSLQMHVLALEEQIDNLSSLRDRLKLLLQDAGSQQSVSQIDVLKGLKEINEMSKHFTPEQIEEFKRRSEQLGPESIAKAQEQWRSLLNEFQQLAAAGESKSSARVSEAAERAWELFQAFSGGNPAVEKGVMDRYQDEGVDQILGQHDLPFDQAGWNLMQQALAELRKKRAAD